MCGLDPLTMLQIASAVGKVAAEQDAADAQSAANRAATAQANYKKANDIALNNVQRGENYAEKSAQANKANLEANKAIATGVTAAGEAGVQVAGSALLQLQELGAQGSTDVVAAMGNFLKENNSLDAQWQNIFITEANTIARLPAVKQPDFLGAALQIGLANAQLTKDTGMGIFDTVGQSLGGSNASVVSGNSLSNLA